MDSKPFDPMSKKDQTSPQLPPQQPSSSSSSSSSSLIVGLDRTSVPTITEEEEEEVVVDGEALLFEATPTVVATLVTIDETINTPTTSTTTPSVPNPAPSTYHMNDTVMLMNRSDDDDDDDDPTTRSQQRGRCLLHGFICLYVALDFRCHTLGCSRTSDCLCCRHNFCCAIHHKHYGLGVSMANDIYDPNGLLTCSAICCECGIIRPTSLCTSTEQVFCIQSVGSIPFHPHYVPRPILAYYGLSCCPTCDCCVAPPPCPAIAARQHHPDTRNSQSPSLWTNTTTNHNHLPRDGPYSTTFHMIPPSPNNVSSAHENPMYRD